MSTQNAEASRALVKATTSELSRDEIREQALLAWRGIAGVPQEQLPQFVEIAASMGLNPLLGQIVLLEVYDQRLGRKVFQPYPTAKGVAKVAADKGVLDGMSCSRPEFDKEVGAWAAKATVWVKGCNHPFENWGYAKPGGKGTDQYQALAITRAYNRVLRDVCHISLPTLEELDNYDPVTGQVEETARQEIRRLPPAKEEKTWRYKSKENPEPLKPVPSKQEQQAPEPTELPMDMPLAVQVIKGQLRESTPGASRKWRAVVWLVEYKQTRATVWCFHLNTAAEATNREDPENFTGELLVTLGNRSYTTRNHDTGAPEERSILTVEHVDSLELGPPLDLDKQEEADGSEGQE